ncbi:MAG: FAD/NAD(P)-binding protein [Desulfobulbaceae bacterium]|nr:FAD/NAD(P)-binding protein [Desulfobulbaceae bacterium]
MKNIENNYLPYPAQILKVVKENSQIKTFELAFTDQDRNSSFTYLPGQFMMVSVPHRGEAPISIASTPTRPGMIELSIRRAGTLTNAMHTMKAGDTLGLRGPYGRPFPLKEFTGRDLVFVAGGIGLAPLRSLINYCLDHHNEYGQITLLYGSRSPEDIAFSDDLTAWQDTHSIKCLLSVDSAGPDWHGQVGLVTTLLDLITPDPARSSAIVCGPSIMIRFVLAALSRIGFADTDIITTLERHMKCGIGVCRHCHMDRTLVCADGPVFSLAQLRGMQGTELL